MRILLVIALVLPFIFAEDYAYAIVVDAGSSGSRAYVYAWAPRKTQSEIPIVYQVFQQRVQPGISSFAQNVTKVRPYIHNLIRSAMYAIPSFKWKITPVFLYSTAGMRFLHYKVINALFEQIQMELRTFPLIFKDSYARILSGNEEGVFGWIQVNYAMGTIKEGTFGALDMGGASTQITFIPDGVLSDNAFPVIIARRLLRTYAYSHIRFGNDQTYIRSKELILSRESPVKVTPDDVYIYNHPCIPLGFLSAEETISGKRVRFNGTSDIEGCYNITYTLLNLDVFCGYPKPCSMNGIYQPAIPPKMKFYAFSSYYYIMYDLNLTETNAYNGPISRLLSATNEFCKMDVEGQRRATPAPDHIEKICFMAYWNYNTLVNGYNFEPSSTAITFTNQLPGALDTGWTLGALLFELQVIDVDIKPSAGFSIHGFPYSSFLIIMMLYLFVCI